MSYNIPINCYAGCVVRRIKEYWYIDKDGIDSIINQISEEHIVEKKLRKTKQNRGILSAKAGLSALMNKIIKADFELSGETGCETMIEKTSVSTYENKIEKIITYVKDKESYFESLSFGIANCYDENLTFINVHDNFFTRQPFDSHEGVASIYKAGYLLFEKGAKLISGKCSSIPEIEEYTFNYNDNYFKDKYDKSQIEKARKDKIKMEKRIVMSLNITKLTTSISYTSHMGRYLRYLEGRNISLGIFGHIYKAGDYYQIKPFAVWRF